MLEDRSFDHMLGLSGIAEIDASSRASNTVQDLLSPTCQYTDGWVGMPIRGDRRVVETRLHGLSMFCCVTMAGLLLQRSSSIPSSSLSDDLLLWGFPGPSAASCRLPHFTPALGPPSTTYFLRYEPSAVPRSRKVPRLRAS